MKLPHGSKSKHGGSCSVTTEVQTPLTWINVKAIHLQATNARHCRHSVAHWAARGRQVTPCHMTPTQLCNAAQAVLHLEQQQRQQYQLVH
jgi:hypothetical protein